MPELAAAIRERPDAALLTVVVGGRREHIQQVITGTGLKAPVLLDVPPSGKTQTLRNRYGINQVPWTLVLDRTGHGSEVIVGARDSAGFVRALDRATERASKSAD